MKRRAVLRALVSIGLLVISVDMLLFGRFFESAYDAGMPPWLHTIAGLAAAAIGLIGLVSLAARVPWRRVFRALGTAAAMKSVCGIAALVFSASWLWERFRPLPVVPGASREAVAFFDGALRHMERFYLRQAGVDWPDFRRRAFRRIEGARTARDTFGAVRATLADLGPDAHNWLAETSGRTNTGRRGSYRPPLTTARMTKDGIAYVSVPGFMGGNWGALYRLGDMEGEAYARRLREKLRALDERNPRGWIVDLRGDDGGSMWPMLDGLAPLIGEGRIAALDMPQFGQRADTWIFSSYSYSSVPWFAGLGAERLRLKNGGAPVAILTAPDTASAGEGVVVAFKGRPRTRQFGLPTCGVSTSPDGYALGHGAILYVTVARQMDRTGRTYDGPIQPDEAVDDSGDGDASRLMAAATRWIEDESRGPKTEPASRKQKALQRWRAFFTALQPRHLQRGFGQPGARRRDL